MAQIDPLLQQLISQNASDLHLSPGREPMIRLHGEITKMGYDPYSSDDLNKMLREIAPEHFLSVWDESQDMDFAYSLDNSERFRVNVFLDHFGRGAVLRHIPNKLPTFDDIKLEDGGIDLCNLTKGLVLVTGPTGSGKSTTLAAMMNHINQTKNEHIVTIEDPIEFVYKSDKSLVHQRELQSHTKSFSNALRAVLRQDPDVILVGEMRDVETTRMAIEAAETGHLVFGTLHTNTAFSTITRIIYQFSEEEQELVRSMLAENLKGVICQSLLKREDGTGRVAAREILLYTVGGANLIRENKLHQIQSQIDGGQEIGMQSLNGSLTKLVSEGIISPTEALSKSMDHKDLSSRLTRIGIHLDEVEYE